jgi:aminoglycoside phosphotransferase (APT) family kinase protein
MRGDDELIGLAVRHLGLGEPSVEVLTGGSRNRCYAVSDGDREVVLRIAGEDDRAYAVARAAESLAQRTAAAQGLAPRILFEEPGLGLTAMQRVAGGAWTRELARSPAGAACLGRWLGRLHQLPPPSGMRRVDFVSSLDHYAAELGDDAMARELARRARPAAAVGGPAARDVLCHNDLHHLNIVGSREVIQVIDWEYAGVGEPIMDIASYLAYHDLDAPATSALLEAYGAGPAAPSLARLADARWLFEAVWWAWLELHRRLHPDEAAEFRDARQRLAARLAPGPRTD